MGQIKPDLNQKTIIIDCVEQADQVLSNIIILGDLNVIVCLDNINISDPCVYMQSVLGTRQLIISPN